MTKSDNRPMVLSLVLGLAVFVVFNFLKPYPIHDEGPRGHHLDTVDWYREMWLGHVPYSLDCGNGMGVLFYTIYGAFAAVDHQLWFIRLPSLLCFLGSLWLLVRWLNPAWKQMPLFLLTIFGSTWMLRSGFTVHGEQMSFFLSLMALSFLVLSPAKGFSLYGGLISLAMVPWVRLFAVYVYAQIFVESLFLHKRRWKLWLWLMLAAVPFILLVLHWKGLVSPSFRLRSAGQNLTFEPERIHRILSTTAHMGIYLMPWLFIVPEWGRRLFSKPWWVALVFFAAVGYFLPLGSAGPLDSAFRLVFHFETVRPFVSMSERIPGLGCFYGVGLGIGVAALIHLVNIRAWENQMSRLSLSALLVYTVLLPFTGSLFVERYFFPVHIWINLLAWSQMPPERATWWPMVPMFLIGLGHALT